MSSTKARAIVQKYCIGNYAERNLRDLYKKPVFVRSVKRINLYTAHLKYKFTRSSPT